MLNNKIITAGVVAVIILAVVYLGNKVMTTTPQSGALGQAQYKVITLWDRANRDINLYQDIENQLNKYAKDGWELVEVMDQSNGHALILKKD